jgi:hypothetical protein
LADAAGNALRAQLPPFELPQRVIPLLLAGPVVAPLQAVREFMDAYRTHCLQLLDCIYQGSNNPASLTRDIAKVVRLLRCGRSQMDALLASFWRGQWERRAMFGNAALVDLVIERDAEVYRYMSRFLASRTTHA